MKHPDLLAELDQLIAETRAQTMAVKVERLLESACPDFRGGTFVHGHDCPTVFYHGVGADPGHECEPPPKYNLGFIPLWGASDWDMEAARYSQSMGIHPLIRIEYDDVPRCAFCNHSPARDDAETADFTYGLLDRLYFESSDDSDEPF